ncbi:MAG: HAMP domain-containing histidine kinase [Clostridia bacterium]|nr:HAMP domain-containing histidine kinase [Clostridia bacterium]MBN2883224.1 HAMP domain-containing histidine kinase [Clostridia bacterium]
MTSLNKLFTRYFILTVTVVLLLTTLVSNFGASIFFRSFIRANNIIRNERIVEVVTGMVEDEELSQNAYPMILGMLSRQQDVNIMLSRDDTVIFKSNIIRTPNEGSNEVSEPEYVNLEYEISGYTLIIGRVKDPLYDIGNAEFVRTLNIMYAVLFVISMLIAILTAFVLSKRFNRPIMQLKENVNNIAMNRFDKVIKPDSKARELRELSDDIERLAEQMKHEEDMRKRLSNDIVHELKTPIAVLSTNIEAILDGIYKADEERMSVLLDQINRLTRLVNNLSDLTLLEADYSNMKLEDIDLSEILESLFTVYSPVADDSNIIFKKSMEATGRIKGNKDRLLQVFVNVLSNAFKYTDSGGTITVSLHENSSEVICIVEDTGMGIDEKDIPFIFNRFYRGDESRSRETGGAGIGLSIAKTVISAHGGDIKVESKKGVGTKIYISFPKKLQ